MAIPKPPQPSNSSSNPPPAEADVIEGEVVLDAELLEGESVLEAELLEEPREPPPNGTSAAENNSLPAPMAPRPASSEMFSLDLDDQPPQPSEESFSSVGPLVSLTPILGETITKPAKNGRPPIKITYVRPGEKSPLAK